ncbi:MAG: iron-containing alcohol dehydrogenase [Gaiellaceae bacterium]
MIVRWGLEALPPLLEELGLTRPFVVAGPRWDGVELGVKAAGGWREVPSDRIVEAARAGRAADSLLAVGGGSAIDLGKAVAAETGLALVSVPTTYAGAEWTPYFGVRDRERLMRGGGSGARLAGAVYEPRLTLGLPHATTGGTAMNALAHCAEALYVQGHNAEADAHALAGAALIGTWLPRALDDGHDLEARTRLLEGACEAGAALGGSMLGLAHALAQVVGGRYGLPHGTLNGICLPAAIRFNSELAPAAVRRFGEALGANDPAARVEELAALAGPSRLRELDVPESHLGELAAVVAGRPGNLANPRPANPAEIEAVLHSIW